MTRARVIVHVYEKYWFLLLGLRARPLVGSGAQEQGKSHQLGECAHHYGVDRENSFGCELSHIGDFPNEELLSDPSC